ncbi:MAG: hypothetical protein JW894_10580 [Bacteroidales bacterium]|nr:hypothetical protein [Bacteroidales bacterium]
MKRLNYYKSRLELVIKKLQKKQKLLRFIGLMRFIVFLLILLAFFILMPKNTVVGVVSAGVLLILFLTLVKYYHKQNSQVRHLQKLAEINDDEIKIQSHSFHDRDAGEEFIDSNHPYAFDMDLFGRGSLFQYMNRTVTSLGRKKFADLLLNETLISEDILSRQHSVQELKEKIDLSQNFMASGKLHSDSMEDIEQLIKWIEKPLFYLNSKLWMTISKVIPLTTLVSITLAVYFPAFRLLAIVFYLIQLFIISSRLSVTSKEHLNISKRYEALKKYGFLFRIIQENQFNSEALKKISESLVTGPLSAAKSIKKLSKIVKAFDSRLNFLVALFIEGLLLWDIQCMIRLEKWKKLQGHHFEMWMDTLANFDSFVTLSTFAFNHPGFAIPELSDKVILESNELGHPLIRPEDRVCNHFTVREEGILIVITGANMAGKSTFLRTVAVNMILAMTGTTVCAKNFVFKPMSIFSSMRTSDSLDNNESYFYAELKRLKQMLDRLKEGESLFVILDEILKGTNSADKQKGSRAVLERIIKYNGTGIIATHDLSLAVIEKEFPDNIINKCFEIEIDNASVYFDYILRDGITTKMNASLLMKQMGILTD